MIGFLIRYRYFVLSGTIALALIIGWSIVKGRIYDQGYAACEAKYEEAKHKADEATRARQREIRKKTEVEENEVRKAQGADAPASSYLRGVLSRMQRENHQGERRDSRRSTVNP